MLKTTRRTKKLKTKMLDEVITDLSSILSNNLTRGLLTRWMRRLISCTQRLSIRNRVRVLKQFEQAGWLDRLPDEIETNEQLGVQLFLQCLRTDGVLRASLSRLLLNTEN